MDNTAKKPELSNLFFTDKGLEAKNSEELMDIAEKGAFLKKELKEITDLLELNIDDYLPYMIPFFKVRSDKNQSLYVIGKDSYYRLLENGMDVSFVKDYAQLRSMDNNITSDFLSFRELYRERNCGNITFIEALK